MFTNSEPPASRPKFDQCSLDHCTFKSLPTGSPKVDELTERLNKLSVEERDEALNDLHGVSDQIKETPALIKSKKQELTYALISSIAKRPKESEAYQKALIQSSSFVEDMKLAFLRAEAFQVSDAAMRMIRHFKMKRELFGEETLTKHIEWSDLGDEEREIMRQGQQHLLPYRDRAGRVIFFLNPQVNSRFPKHETGSRATFYLVCQVLQEEEHQIKGVVDIYWGLGLTKEHVVQGRLNKMMELAKALPWRLEARHVCWQMEPHLKPLYSFAIKTMENKFLYRFRFHTGTNTECMYSLMTFGIPREALPITQDGSLDLTDHHRVLRALQCREERGAAFTAKAESRSAVLVPGPMDVLMGRGRQPAFRPGLLRMHNLLMEHQETYEAAPRLQKVNVAKTVLQEMKDSGCRFVKEAPVGHIECDDAEAIKKISHGFRNLRMKSKTQSDNPQTTTVKKRVLEDA